jgi:hypothetical protein
MCACQLHVRRMTLYIGLTSHMRPPVSPNVVVPVQIVVPQRIGPPGTRDQANWAICGILTSAVLISNEADIANSIEVRYPVWVVVATDGIWIPYADRQDILKDNLRGFRSEGPVSRKEVPLLIKLIPTSSAIIDILDANYVQTISVACSSHTCRGWTIDGPTRVISRESRSCAQPHRSQSRLVARICIHVQEQGPVQTRGPQSPKQPETGNTSSVCGEQVDNGYRLSYTCDLSFP